MGILCVFIVCLERHWDLQVSCYVKKRTTECPQTEGLTPYGEANQHQPSRVDERVDDDVKLERLFGMKFATSVILRAGGVQGFFVKVCGCVRVQSVAGFRSGVRTPSC